MGKFLTLSPEYSFVIEDDVGICGYVVAGVDARDLSKKSKMSWIPTMCEKYPLTEKKESCSPVDVSIKKINPVKLLLDALFFKK